MESVRHKLGTRLLETYGNTVDYDFKSVLDKLAIFPLDVEEFNDS